MEADLYGIPYDDYRAIKLRQIHNLNGSSADGIYVYRHDSALGRMSQWFEVRAGVIQVRVTNGGSIGPLAQYQGNRFAEFCDARLALDWEYKDDSLKQYSP